MRDVGPLTYFLGLEESYTANGILLSQRKYTNDLISAANLTDKKIYNTPWR